MYFFSAKKWHWRTMALSERGFYEPKRFTMSPGLTITKVRIWGPKPSKMSKNQHRFLISLAIMMEMKMKMRMRAEKEEEGGREGDGEKRGTEKRGETEMRKEENTDMDPKHSCSCAKPLSTSQSVACAAVQAGAFKALAG